MNYSNKAPRSKQSANRLPVRTTKDNMQKFDWIPVTLHEIKAGDVIATDTLDEDEETTADIIVEVYEDIGGYTEGVVKEITSKRISNKTTTFTITLEDGEVFTLDERSGCYCGCRDYICTIKIVPAQD